MCQTNLGFRWHWLILLYSSDKPPETKLDLMAEMLNFSLMTSCRLMTLGGAWWVLGYILVIKEETEINYILSLSEVQ